MPFTKDATEGANEKTNRQQVNRPLPVLIANRIKNTNTRAQRFGRWWWWWYSLWCLHHQRVAVALWQKKRLFDELTAAMTTRRCRQKVLNKRSFTRFCWYFLLILRFNIECDAVTLAHQTKCTAKTWEVVDDEAGQFDFVFIQRKVECVDLCYGNGDVRRVGGT